MIRSNTEMEFITGKKYVRNSIGSKYQIQPSYHHPLQFQLPTTKAAEKFGP
jgi:hypothetical protein